MSENTPLSSHPHVERQTARPLVSICIPAYNGAQFIRDAVDSALSQTYEPLEVVIADDRSTDATYSILQAYDDPRLRLSLNGSRLGHVGNRNHVLAQSSGLLIKFLDQDDLLDPTCVAEMVAVFLGDPDVGFVFSRRRVVAHDMADTDNWVATFADLHSRFGELKTVNSGREMMGRWLTAGAHGNWIGEPVTVMATRAHLTASGGFNPCIRQMIDMDLWMRLAVHSTVGFVDRELATYRHGHPSVTTQNALTRTYWLDRLWMLEVLARDPQAQDAYPGLSAQLSRERRAAWRTCAKLGYVPDRTRVPVRPYFSYMRYRLEAMLGRPPRVRVAHGSGD